MKRPAYVLMPTLVLLAIATGLFLMQSLYFQLQLQARQDFIMNQQADIEQINASLYFEQQDDQALFRGRYGDVRQKNGELHISLQNGTQLFRPLREISSIDKVLESQ
jgi:hypothetical protein